MPATTKSQRTPLLHKHTMENLFGRGRPMTQQDPRCRVSALLARARGRTLSDLLRSEVKAMQKKAVGNCPTTCDNPNLD